MVVSTGSTTEKSQTFNEPVPEPVEGTTHGKLNN